MAQLFHPTQVFGLGWTHAPITGFTIATAGAPTLAELETWLAAQPARPYGHVYFTNSDTATDAPTLIWWSGSNNVARLISGGATAAGLAGAFSAATVYPPLSYVYDDGGLWFSTAGAAASATKPINALGTAANQWIWVSGTTRVGTLPSPNALGPLEVRLVDITAKNGTQYYLENVGGTLIYVEENSSASSTATVPPATGTWGPI